MKPARLISAAALAAVLMGAAGAASAQEAEEIARVAEDAGAMPWYRSFTEDSDAFDVTGQALLSEGSEVIVPAGSRWDLRFGLDSREVNEELRVDGLRAGAFFNITPRMRVGGELGYVAREDSPLLDRGESDAPQVKVESSLRF